MRTWSRFEVGGRVYSKSTRTSNKADALAIANVARADVLRDGAGLARDESRREIVPLSKLAARYLDFARRDHALTADTDDARIIARFVAIIGATKPVRDIRADHIEWWQAKRLTEKTRRGSFVKKQTVNRELNPVRAMFREAAKWYALKSNPCAGFDDMQTDDADVRLALPADELALAFRELPDPFGLLCEVTYECLPRLAEVVNLRADDLGFSTVRGRDGEPRRAAWLSRRIKGGKRHRAMISVALAERLLARVTPSARLSAESPRIFPELDADSTSARMTPLFRALGIKASHHNFRHSGITDMLVNGTDVRTIQTLAGWSSLKQLQRYGHVTDLALLDAVEAQAERIRALKAAPPPPVDLAARGERARVVAADAQRARRALKVASR